MSLFFFHLSLLLASLAKPKKELLQQSIESQKQDILDGIQALQRGLRDINAAIREQELQEAYADLVARVQDWKNHRIDDFGKLMLFDVLQVDYKRSVTVCTVPAPFQYPHTSFSSLD